MAINNIITESWQGHSHGEVEDALKAILLKLKQDIENSGVPAGGITADMLASALRNAINDAVPNSRTINGKPLSSNVTLKTSDIQNDSGYITQADIPEGATADTQMSSTSENGVQNKVIKAYVDAVSQRIDTLIGSGNVQGAIDTFNEVVAFLNGINSSDTLAAKLLLKANAADVYTKTEVDDAIEDAVEGLGGGSVESVTINGTNHTPTNGVVDLGTIVGQQGPAGNTYLVDENFDPVSMIINGLDESDGTVALSARQGKILKAVIIKVFNDMNTVLNALAGVAFTNLPKPTLDPIDWTGGTFYVSITKSLTGVDDTNDAVQVAENASYTNTLTPQSGLTMRSVVVKMGGVDITSTAYTAATGVISIAQVTGSIVITAVAELVIAYNVRNHLLNMSSSNAASTIEKGDTFTAQITPDSGCTSNNDLKVLIGGLAATLGTDYTFVDGTLEIEDVAGDIDIIASAYTDVITFKTTATGTTTLKLTGGGTDFNSQPITTLVNGDSHTPDANGVFTLSADDTISFVGHDINTITIGDRTAIKSIDFGGARVSINNGLLSDYANAESIEGLVFRPYQNGTNRLGYFFYGCSSLRTIDISHCYGLDQYTQTSIGKAFEGCTALERIVCVGVELQSVTDMGLSFSSCPNLQFIDLISTIASVASINQIMKNSRDNITLRIGNMDMSHITSANDTYMIKVKTLICTTATPPDNSLLNRLTGLTAIYVPSDAVSVYKTAWSSVENIIHPVTDYTE